MAPYRSAAGRVDRAPALASGWSPAAPSYPLARGRGPARRPSRMRKILSMRPLRAEMLLIIGYLVATRVFSLTAAKVGIELGPVPLFLTDLTLLGLLACALVKEPGRIMFWLSSGRGATGSGLALWLLCGMSIVYFQIAFPIYKIMAVRDLAIFEYSLFFPLAYFALRNRGWAIRVTRYCVYSGVVLAVLMLAQKATGIDLWLGELSRNINGQWVTYVGGDDYGAITASALMGLIAYLIFERDYRRFHAAGAILCFLALAANGARSAVVGAALAGAAGFMLLSTRYRIIFGILFAGLICGVVAGATLPETIPGVPALHSLSIGMSSALSGGSDMDAQFRIERWRDVTETWLSSPLFGVGFGRNILHREFVGSGLLGKFNEGMPHNTYLFLLARMGLVGFALVVIAMGLGIVKLGYSVKRYRQADDFAAFNVLVTLAGYAAFVLFFERPMNNAGFWIMLAAGVRLAETSRAAMLARLAMPRHAPPRLRQSALAAVSLGRP
ncbi:MAG TPA: O-antigen ligase family protein [Candidatus Binataceae bacterium]|nr:O-antigen ligase family protein [Candidatus Binataceae bacterium]